MFRQFLSSRSGSFSSTLSILVPIIATVGVGSIDYAMTIAQRSDLQHIADEASTGAARELVLGASDATRIKAVAEAIVADGLARHGLSTRAFTVAATAIDSLSGVKVDLSVATEPMLAGVMPDTVGVTSTARMSGTVKLCILTLEPKAAAAVAMVKAGQLHANGCSVYVNSTDKAGITVDQTATLASNFTCSGGGYTESGQYQPVPITDCPPTADPLTTRKAPTVGACTETLKTVSTGTLTLSPGVYCGGLKISGSAVVDLKPGIYVMKDGPLVVTGKGTLRGKYVGFYFTGDASIFDFTENATVEIGAPKDGALAGLLFFEDRAGKAGKQYKISSTDTNKLLGTIYLPLGKLRVDSPEKVADKSEYTALVVNTLEMSGAQLVINANYEQSDVPVPTGLGNTTMAAKIYVAR